ncbi:hypothetical protein D5038_19130 [Verminephrobacter aporrectodeae subsp. tuberculatae]|nr:hypothetical protein [Verminephrobacter aporrectodeae subsp. tuberculatae]
MGLYDIIRMAQIDDEKKKSIIEECFNVQTALVQAEKAAKPLMDEIRSAEQKLCLEGVTTQSNGRVINTPGILLVDNSRVFLKFAKQALQHLAAAMGMILDEDFKGPHFHVVRDRAMKVFGADHSATILLVEDQTWIKNIIDMRNEEEHPKSGKPFVRGFHISRATEGEYEFIIDPPRFYNDLMVLNHLEVYSHNLLTFAEEVVSLSLQTYFPKIVTLAEIPEEQRDPSAPIRFRLTLKEGVNFPKS